MSQSNTSIHSKPITQICIFIQGTDLRGKTVAISGSGNVALYATEKVNELGGKVNSEIDIHYNVTISKDGH